MAYDYKTIGNTAAKVVSILAVSGGLLWWQRTTTPVDIPRPQDEAEIMTAVLERHYAMGRTNTQFTKTYAANVSAIIVSNRYASFTVDSSRQSGGMNLVKNLNTKQEISWPVGQVFTSTTGIFISTNLHVDIYPDATGGYFLAKWYPNFWTARWSGYFDYDFLTTFPPDNPGYSDDSLILSVVTVAASNALVYVPVHQYITNSPAHTDTNTVGMFPNATFQYPDEIRSAIDKRTVGSDDIQWCVPTNTSMVSDSGQILWGYECTNYMDVATNYWTNLVTLATGIWHSTTNYTYTNVVYTNFPPSTNWFWQTNILHRSTNYSNATTNDVTGGKLCAFERDQNSLYWSTNAYNDMARALSLMQWQHDQRPKTTGRSKVRWYGLLGGWPVVPLNRFPYTDTNTPAASCFTNYCGIDQTATAYFRVGNASALPNEGINWFASWVAINAYDGYFTYGLWCRSAIPAITNDISFAITNGQWWVGVGTNIGNGLNPIPASISASATPDVYGNVNIPKLGFCAASKGWAESEQPFLDVTDAEWDDMCAKFKVCVDRLYQYGSVNSGPPLYTQRSYIQPGTDTGTYSGTNVPYCAPFTRHWTATYRVQFSALTNYLNHAPVR